MKKNIIFLVTLLLILTGCATSNTGSSSDKEATKDTENKKEKVVLYVTRHGKTMFNTSHRSQGWSDTPLTDEGVKIAEQLGKGLKKENITFSRSFSSDSGRARETAKLVLANNGQNSLESVEDNRLREVCFGIFEGDTDENMWGAVANELDYDSMEEYAQSGKLDLSEACSIIKKLDTTGMAEDFDTVKQRMQEALKEIAKETEESGGGNVLVVAHGLSILSMISDLTDEKPEGGQLANASVTKIVYENGAFDVVEVGSLDYVETGLD